MASQLHKPTHPGRTMPVRRPICNWTPLLHPSCFHMAICLRPFVSHSVMCTHSIAIHSLHWMAGLWLCFFFFPAVNHSHIAVSGSETDKPEWPVCRHKLQRDSAEAAINQENTISLVLKLSVTALHLWTIIRFFSFLLVTTYPAPRITRGLERIPAALRQSRGVCAPFEVKGKSIVLGGQRKYVRNRQN